MRILIFIVVLSLFNVFVCPVRGDGEVNAYGIQQDERIDNKILISAIDEYNAKNYTKSLSLFSSLSEKGSNAAIFYLALHNLNGYGTEISIDKYVDLLQKSAKLDYPDAILSLGNLYHEGKYFSQDYRRAAALYKRAIDLGSYEAKYNLANMYYLGLGVEKNYSKAFSYYLDISENTQHDRSTYLVCQMYYFGEGKDADKKRGLPYCEQAAKKDNPDAMYLLGLEYTQGAVVQKDYAKAYQYYLEAAELGNAAAQTDLALMIYNGYANLSLSKAHSWLQNAAEKGDRKAQKNLGIVYLNGTGVKKDIERGCLWVLMSLQPRVTDDAKQKLQFKAENELYAYCKKKIEK